MLALELVPQVGWYLYGSEREHGMVVNKPVPIGGPVCTLIRCFVESYSCWISLTW